MRPDTQLDYAIFQLTPNLERCELHVVSQGSNYKLASGLLKPFLAHLVAAEEQIRNGGQSIRLEPPDPAAAAWFTKGTVERFVRFVSTPEVLEMVTSIEMELMEIEEAIRVQSNDTLGDHNTEDQFSASTGGMSEASPNLEQQMMVHDPLDGGKSGHEQSTKQWLLRALDARWMVLQKEQSMLFTRAIAAGFSVKHVNDLVIFAETFQAPRLRDACVKFEAVCQKKQETGLWPDNLDSGSAQAHSMSMGTAGENMMGYPISKPYPDAELNMNDFRRASLPAEGNLPAGGVQQLPRQGSIEDHASEFIQMAGLMVPPPAMMGVLNADQIPLGYSSTGIYGRHQLPPEDMQAVGYAKVNGEYMVPVTGAGLGLGVGQPNVATWQGPPQDQYSQSIPPFMASVYNIPEPYRHPSGDIQAWQMYNTMPPQNWPPSQGHSDIGPTIYNKGEAASLNKVSSVLEGTSNEDVLGGKNSDGTSDFQDPKPYSQIEPQKPVLESDEPGIDPPGPTVDPEESELDSQKTTFDSKNITLPTDNAVHHQNGEPDQETDRDVSSEGTRRVPRRAASPSRRSASPMRKVQIGFRRSGIAAKRSINYNASDRSTISDDDVEHSESENEKDAIGETRTRKAEVEQVRVRVQDVIGLFESKKEDINITKKQTIQKESRRLASKNSVLSRWTDPAASQQNSGEAQSSLSFDKEDSVHDSTEVLTKQHRSKETENSNQEAESKLDENAECNKELETNSEQGNLNDRMSSVGDSFIDLQRNKCSPTDISSVTLDVEVTAQGTVQPPSDDSFIIFEPRASQVSASSVAELLSQRTDIDDSGNGSRNSDVEIPESNVSADDWHLKNVESQPPNGLHVLEVGDSAEKLEDNSKKTSVRDAKAKAMQDMLEKRKASAGNRSSKPNPLAEAQSRAEKLRAYKANLQQSKREKEEEERKRIEDLKTQRRERIASRNQSQGGTVTADSPSTKRTPRTPPLNVSRTSPTSAPHTLNSSPRSSLHATASLSPNVSKSKASSGSKPPRTPSSISKTNENPLSQSVPSLSELRKDSPKTTPSVRASTGSQRFSQVKKTRKDADSAPAAKANTHTEEKKRPSSLANGRKGIPPAKDTKADRSPSLNRSPVSASKQRKRLSSGTKSSSKRDSVDTGNNKEPISQVSEPEVIISPEETDVKVNDQGADEPPCEGGNDTEQDNALAESPVPASHALEVIGTDVDELDVTLQEPTTPAEAEKSEEEPKDDANSGCSDGEHLELEGISKASEDFVVRINSMSPKNDTATMMNVDSDLTAAAAVQEKDESDTPICDPPEQNQPCASVNEYLLTPSKNLPRLHEAIQQAHSPDHRVGASKARKAGSQKGSKDNHAKGLKRLLLLGRKSSRTSVLSSTELDTDHEVREIASSSTRNSGSGSILGSDGLTNPASSSVPGQSNARSGGDVTIGSSSTKGSRSFFSLSALRGKSEGKAL